MSVVEVVRVRNCYRLILNKSMVMMSVKIRLNKLEQRIVYQTLNISKRTFISKICQLSFSIRVSSDSSIPHENQSICLITAAQVDNFLRITKFISFAFWFLQAAHWFDLKQFYAEAQRTLKPQGVLAVYGYGVPSVKDSVEVDRVIQNVIFVF